MELTTAEAFVAYWDNVRARTRRVVMCIPPEHIEWSHAPDRWTLGDLVRHLAAVERYMYAENAQGRPSRYHGHGRELADGFEAVVHYLDALHAESMAIFRALTPEQLSGRSTTPGGTSITTWKWLRAMIEHEAHHRGQLYLMLGMLGAPTPPIFGLTEEEMRARSVS
jgi:uncharacterized damage-inducible protein DinB